MELRSSVLGKSMATPLTVETLDPSDGLIPSVNPMEARAGLVKADNVCFHPEKIDVLRAMPGYQRVTSAAADDDLRSIYYAKGANDTRRVYVGYGTKVGRVKFSDNTLPNVKTGLTADKHVVMTSFGDFMFCCNGVETPFKITLDGSDTVSNVGLTQPDVSSASSALNGTGGVVGTVRYYLAKMTGTTEGPLSDSFGEIDAMGDPWDPAAGSQVDLSSMPSTGDHRLYRTVANGIEPRYVTTLESTATYSDTTPDSQLGDFPFLHGDPPPDSTKSMITHLSRIWGIGTAPDSGSTLNTGFWSDVGNGESFWLDGAGGNWTDIFGDDGDSLVTMTLDGQDVLFWKTGRLYALFYQTSTNAHLRRVAVSNQEDRTIGTPSPNSVKPTSTGTYAYWSKGVYRYRGGQLVKISRQIEADLSAIRAQDEEFGVAVGYYPQRHWLYVSVPLSAGATPTHTYIYDAEEERWIGRMDQGFRGYTLAIHPTSQEEVFLALGTDKRVHDLSDLDFVDYDGTAMACEAEYLPVIGRGWRTVKTFSFIDVTYVPQASGTFDLEVYLDGDDSSVATYSITQTGTASLDRVRVNLGYIGHSLHVRVKSNADQPAWEVDKVEVGYRENREGISE